MEPIQFVLAVSILLCSLVAGLVLTFAIIVMPGIKSLKDRDFLRAFVVMDRVIQNNHPVFMFVWLGSAAAVIVLAILAIWQLDGVSRVVAIVLSAIYILGVQLPTIIINIPLNTLLQSLDLESLNETQLAEARMDFERRWNSWNLFRTVVATVVASGLIILAFRI